MNEINPLKFILIILLTVPVYYAFEFIEIVEFRAIVTTLVYFALLFIIILLGKYIEDLFDKLPEKYKTGFKNIFKLPYNFLRNIAWGIFFGGGMFFTLVIAVLAFGMLAYLIIDSVIPLDQVLKRLKNGNVFTILSLSVVAEFLLVYILHSIAEVRSSSNAFIKKLYLIHRKILTKLLEGLMNILPYLVYFSIIGLSIYYALFDNPEISFDLTISTIKDIIVRLMFIAIAIVVLIYPGIHYNRRN